MSTRRFLSAAVAFAVVASTATALAPSASAASPFTPGRYGSIVGDLTGDGVADRVTLGTITRGSATICAFQLETGTGRNTYGAPVTGRLPVVGRFCPDLGTVLAAPDPARIQLATAFSDFDASVQTFRGLGTDAVRNTGGFDGAYTPFHIRSIDFDGDGYGDVYEDADTAPGFAAWVGRNGAFRQVFATPSGSQWTEPQFLDLDHRGGLDILAVSGIDNFGNTEASVTDGRTGAKQVLANLDGITGANGVNFGLSVVDVNHDTLPDLRLQTDVFRTSGVTTTVQYFVNNSKGTRWSFVKTTV